MKSKGILDLIVFSEYRKTLLFLLQNNPMNLSKIKDVFGVTTPEIQPHLKKLEEAHIITKDNNNYILTPIGNLLADELNPALDTIQTLDNNLEFFNTYTNTCNINKIFGLLNHTLYTCDWNIWYIGFSIS